MRTAPLSDIQANIQALEACLAHARSQQVDRFVFLGDMVGYGANPGAVVDRIMQLTEEGALALQGNHDAMAVSPPAEVRTVGDSTAAWTHHELLPDQRDWISRLPLTQQHEHALFVHASANDPQLWRYVYDARAAKDSLDGAAAWPGVQYVFGGHVHLQTLYYQGADSALMPFAPQPGIAIPVPPHRKWLATVGSAGQPRDGNTLAMYCLFDMARAQLTFHRVAYDHFAAAEAIRRVGLHEFFADRLERGR